MERKKEKRPDTSPARVNHNPPGEHAGWMLCGQKIVFHCVLWSLASSLHG